MQLHLSPDRENSTCISKALQGVNRSQSVRVPLVHCRTRCPLTVLGQRNYINLYPSQQHFLGPAVLIDRFGVEGGAPIKSPVGNMQKKHVTLDPILSDLWHMYARPQLCEKFNRIVWTKGTYNLIPPSVRVYNILFSGYNAALIDWLRTWEAKR